VASTLSTAVVSRSSGGGDYASIDQAALTGESLPVAKKVSDDAYSGSVVKQCEMQGVVSANTFFGRTAKLKEERDSCLS
jgi:cation transport ATPase